jgi:PIN domain nuclease of toxin-antitoxin system
MAACLLDFAGCELYCCHLQGRSCHSIWLSSSPREDTLKRDLRGALQQQFGATGVKTLAIAPKHAYSVSILAQNIGHNIPSDRLLAVQALMERRAIISVDGCLDLYGVTRMW